MFEAIFQSKIASFRLGGERVDIVPSEMTKSADSFSKRVGSLLVILNLETLSEDCYRWHLILRNEGQTKTKQITELYGADIRFPVTGQAKWESLFGDDWTENSYTPLEADFSDRTVLEKEPLEGCSSREGFPYFDVTSEAGCTIFAIGWSGQWKYKLKRMGDTAFLKVGFASCDLYLNPGESIRSAGVIVCCGRKLTETRHKFRRILREKLSPAAKFSPKSKDKFHLPISLQCYDRYFPSDQPWTTSDPNWPTEKGQLHCIEQAKKCSYIDNYWLDAAWFRDEQLGNFDIEKTFPNGLLPISKSAHDNGMTFTLWFEPERIDIHSDTAKEHPEWLLENGNPKNIFRIFALYREDAYLWLRDNLFRMIREQGVDIYRQDCCFGPSPYWRHHEAQDRQGYIENKHVTNLYRLWDALLAEFPGLLIDNCAGGGGRVDYELISRSVPLWRSDSGCHPSDEVNPTYWWHQNQTLGISRYLPYHSTCSWTADTNTFRSAMTMGIACDLEVMEGSFDAEAVKKPLRELISLRDYWDGDFYPLTPAVLGDDVWCAYQLADGDRGFCAFFRRKNAPEGEMTFMLNAICNEKTYEVTLTDNKYNSTVLIVTGSELRTFTAEIENPMESLILVYKAI